LKEEERVNIGYRIFGGVKGYFLGPERINCRAACGQHDPNWTALIYLIFGVHTVMNRKIMYFGIWHHVVW
jgi:hypothetical protein